MECPQYRPAFGSTLPRGSNVLKRAIPVLHVSRSVDAARFYCEGLGFHEQFAYRPDDPKTDPCYMGLERDVVRLHVSSFLGDGVPGGIATFIVDDLDALYAELTAKGVSLDFEPTLQSWGNREMYITDMDRNSVRFIEGKDA
jgi:uncharacterized glyoxalase superfamily protein PhnB